MGKMSNLDVFCTRGWHTASMTMRLLLAGTVRIRAAGWVRGVSCPRPTLAGDVLAARLSGS
jgi:acyl dehydratase